MFRKIKNGEPVFHKHECSPERKGHEMSPAELHEMAVKSLMEEYADTGAIVKRLHKNAPNQPDFSFNSMGRIVNVLVVCTGHDFTDVANVDGSYLVNRYNETGELPRITAAKFFCDATKTGDKAVCGASFVFMYESTSLIPNEFEKPEGRKLTEVELAVKFAETWRKLDTSIVEPYLAKDFHYGSDWVFDELPGRVEFMDYFVKKIETVKVGTRPEVKLVRSKQEQAAGVLLIQGKNSNMLRIKTDGGQILAAQMVAWTPDFEEFDPSEELYQCHGDHIDGIMPSNEFFDKYFQKTISESDIFTSARTKVAFEDIPMTRSCVFSLKYGDGDIAMLNTLALVKRANQNRYLSTYPIMKGKDVEVTIDKVIEWDNMTEATVFCSINDFSFAFFAVDYYANKPKYKVGEILSINMAALGLRVEESPKGFSFEGQKAIDWLAKIGREPDYDENGNVKPVNFSLEQLVAFMAQDSKCPDEYEFQSPAGAIRNTALYDREFVVTDICISREEQNEISDITIPLYFRKEFLPGVSEGIPVRGWLWLTGSITDCHVKDLSGKRTIAETCDDFDEFIQGINFDKGFDNLMHIAEECPLVKIRDGYEFDAFKVGNDSGYVFQTYCCKAGSEIMYHPTKIETVEKRKGLFGKKIEEVKTHVPYSDEYFIQDMISFEEATDVKPASDYFEVPFTEEGLIQAWLLHNSSEFMPHGWYACYGLKDFIFYEEKLMDLFKVHDGDSIDQSLEKERQSVAKAVLSIDPSSLLPNVVISGDSAVINYAYWNDWTGLVMASVNVKKNGAGVIFDSPETKILVEYESQTKF